MYLKQLRLAHFRLFESLELHPAPGLTLIQGGNGSGKTSMLESLYLLGYGRSFRGGARDTLTQAGETDFQIFAHWQDSSSRDLRTGLWGRKEGWKARIDGHDAPMLGDLHQRCAIACFEPGTHVLLAGAAEHRRRFLDWSLFHVEPDFLPIWRRYQRALRQRNMLLKQVRASSEQFDPWEHELAISGEIIDAWRNRHAISLESRIRGLCETLLPELGELGLSYRRGWSRDLGLAERLKQGRESDARMAHTVAGPHRADWRLVFPGLPDGAPLSRGQEKLAALSCVLGQAEFLAEQTGRWPLVLLDDLPSELDREHQARVWQWVAGSGCQVLATATELPETLPANQIESMFHVKRDNAGKGELHSVKTG